MFKINYFFFLFYLILFTSSFIAKSQQADIDFSRLQHIGMEQGLSSNKVNCIFQDKKGFMWIGTDYGLNRYDGYNFKVFLKNPDDSLSLTDNDIKCLTQDAKGNIWIGTPKGLNVMDYKTGRIVPFFAEKNKADSIWKYDITALAADDSCIWIGTNRKGLIEYNDFKEDLRKYVKAINDTDTLAGGWHIDNLIIENNGNILGGMGIRSNFRGLLEIDLKTRNLSRIFLNRKLIEKKNNYSKYSSSNWITSIFKDFNGNIFIGTWSGSTVNSTTKNNCDSCPTIYLEEIMEGKSFFRNSSDTAFKEIKTLNNDEETNGLLNGSSFIEYKPGKYFFCNLHACGVFEIKNSEPQSLNAKTLGYPKGIRIENIFKDISGKLWFITSNGIETIESNYLINAKLYPPVLKDIVKQSLIEDTEGKIWIGTYDKSLFCFDEIAKKNVSYKINNKEKTRFTDILSVSNEKLYGTSDDDLYEFDKVSKSFKKIAKLLRPRVWPSLYVALNGEIWFMHHNKGIAKLNLQSGELISIVPIDTIKGRNNSNNHPFFDDGSQNFYLCSTVQIIEVNYLTSSYKVFDIEKAGLDGNDNSITSVTKDRTGNLWLANRYKGLTAFNLKNQKYYSFSLSDGIPTNKSSRILFLKGAIWVYHQNGIYKFIPPNNLDDKSQNPIIKSYGVKDGLPGINSFAQVMISTHKGEILIAADTTLFSFHPDSIKSNEYIPPVFITKMEVNNHIIEAGDSSKILFSDISSTDTVQLKYFQNTLSFEFAALNYIHADENEYAYKMEGMDTSWIYCGKRRFVTYSNLSPGEYTLHVKGSNNDGVWNEPGTQLKIFIAPPYWQTAWFRLLCLIAVVLSIMGVYKWRTRTLRADKKKLEHKVEERTVEIVKQKEEIEKEKQKSDELLLNILPAEVMEELKSTGKTQARNYDLVTVLFADFKDFTQIIDELPPEELVSGIDNYFETFDRIIGKYPVEKIKTVGDAYICVAGLPQTTSNNPLVMMDAALEMLTSIDHLKQERMNAGKIVFDVRIGIHSGPVVAGVVGIKKFAFDIWGDTVNTAARMQQHGEPGKINISGTTFGLIKHRFQCTYRGRIEVKHKGEVDMYFVEGKKYFFCFKMKCLPYVYPKIKNPL